MSVENTIAALLAEARGLQEENVVTANAVKAEPMKKIDSEDKQGGENEDNKRNNVDTQKEAEGGTSKKPNAATKGATPAEAMSKIKESELDVSEEVEALFNGEDGLTEEFRQKAETIFEAAVTSRVKAELARIEEQYQESLAEQVEGIKEALVEHIDGYLNLMVEQWMENNEIALEASMKTDMLENFVGGLKTLFQESYIEVPEDRFDVLADLEARLEEVTEAANEIYAKNVELQKQVNESIRANAVEEVCEGLSDLEADKLKSLAEELVFESEDSFKQKLQIIRENYFAKKPVNKQTSSFITEETIQEDKEVPASMSQYVSAISMVAKR